nr:MAG TPA: hypothetical protein [Caudoviricetes sp.]
MRIIDITVRALYEIGCIVSSIIIIWITVCSYYKSWRICLFL